VNNMNMDRDATLIFVAALLRSATVSLASVTRAISLSEVGLTTTATGLLIGAGLAGSSVATVRVNAQCPIENAHVNAVIVHFPFGILHSGNVRPRRPSSRSATMLSCTPCSGERRCHRGRSPQRIETPLAA
jgi:hypothetical protein